MLIINKHLLYIFDDLLRVNTAIMMVMIEDILSLGYLYFDCFVRAWFFEWLTHGSIEAPPWVAVSSRGVAGISGKLTASADLFIQNQNTDAVVEVVEGVDVEMFYL